MVMERIKKPLSGYIKIVSAIAFLAFIWFFGNEGKLSVKVILSAIMLTVLYREYMSFKKAPL
jgi:cellobiose-specific phosphotransferase system component IIC